MHHRALEVTWLETCALLVEDWVLFNINNDNSSASYHSSDTHDSIRLGLEYRIHGISLPLPSQSSDSILINYELCVDSTAMNHCTMRSEIGLNALIQE